MEGKKYKLSINEVEFAYQVPPLEEEGSLPVIMMLHGWTGDENAMWIFANRLPSNAILIAPRGIYPTALGGYAWVEQDRSRWPWVDDFDPAMEILFGALVQSPFSEFNLSRMDLVGFSLGAAFAYAISFRQPGKVRRLAGLAGFMPEGADALARNRPLVDKAAYVTHGSQDDLVPVAMARTAVEILETAGARVTYCEDDVGHKLSANCFRGLEHFFKTQQ